MEIVLRSNDPVALGYAQALLTDQGIGCVLLDQHAAALDGSIGAVPRRLCVGDEDLPAARALLADAGLIGAGERP